MADGDGGLTGLFQQWAVILAVCCNIATATILMIDGHDTLLLLSWPLQALGLLIVGYALFGTRDWRLLLLTPVQFYPLAIWAMLLYACSKGDCL